MEKNLKRFWPFKIKARRENTRSFPVYSEKIDERRYIYKYYRDGTYNKEASPNPDAQKLAREALLGAEQIILQVPTGLPLGEMVIHTGFLYATLAVIREQNPHAHVVLSVDTHAPFFFRQFAREGVTIISNSPQTHERKNTLVMEYGLMSASDITIYQTMKEESLQTHLGNLGALVYRYPFSKHGRKRYDNAIRSLFGLKENENLYSSSQPTVLLNTMIPKSVRELVRKLEIDDKTITIGIIPEANAFHSMDWDGSVSIVDIKHLTKDNWKEVLGNLASHCEKTFPGRKVIFNVFLNPNPKHDRTTIISPLKDSQEELQALVHEENPHASVAIHQLILEDLAQFLHLQKIVVSNDTGPAHLAAALQKRIPVIVPFIAFIDGKLAYDVWRSADNMIPVVSRDIRRRYRKYNSGRLSRREAYVPVSELISMQDVISTTIRSLKDAA